MTFISFPIEDRQVPPSAASVAELVHKMKVSLDAGKHVIVHCRQGIGRTGLIAACLLAESGMETGAALDLLSAARGLPIPETMEQKAWVERFAGKEPVSA
jgi:protein-tyrosine phosphatase